MVQLPFLNDAFHTTPLAIGGWLICVGLASVVMWADEAKKLGERWPRITGLGRGQAEADLGAIMEGDQTIGSMEAILAPRGHFDRLYE